MPKPKVYCENCKHTRHLSLEDGPLCDRNECPDKYNPFTRELETKGECHPLESREPNRQGLCPFYVERQQSARP